MTARRPPGLRATIAHHPAAAAAIATGAAMAATALFARMAALRAEQVHPPKGEFVEIDGVRVHYREAGQGPVVLLLHGNGAMAEDFVISGLFHRLAQDYRVIAPDRPGFGYSERPRDRIWTPPAQAQLMADLLRRLDATDAIVLGHSWGSLVALSLALDTKADLRGLVLLSGYYYPTARADVGPLAAPALPVVGDVMRYTVSPIAGRLLLPEIFRRLFTPRPVSARFKARFPKGLALRPWQMRASAAETGLMIPAAAANQGRYAELRLPVVIMAGEGDSIVNPDRHSRRLHDAIRGSDLQMLPGIGHMMHYAAADRIKQAVDAVARRG